VPCGWIITQKTDVEHLFEVSLLYLFRDFSGIITDIRLVQPQSDTNPLQNPLDDINIALKVVVLRRICEKLYLR
jgi:hypothetical protein